MVNYRKIFFDIDFTAKQAVNNVIASLDELTQNDHNSSILALKLLQDGELIDLTDLEVVLNFLLPSGEDYRVDIVNPSDINTETSIVTYPLPQEILSKVGTVVGTVSLYKDGYRYTSIVQFKFQVVEDIVDDAEIVNSDKYPILTSLIKEIGTIHADESARVEAESVRVNTELERIEAEEERESAEASMVLSELERQESEESRMISEFNRETMENERQKAEITRMATLSEIRDAENTRVQSEQDRQTAEDIRNQSEEDRVQSEQDRQSKEIQRQQKETERQNNESARVQAEVNREAKQNEFNTRAEEVALRIEEEAQRINELVTLKEDERVKPNDMMDYMGNQHESLKDKADSDVEYILGEVNTVRYEGQTITATDTIERQVRSAILNGCTLVNVANTIQKPWYNDDYVLSYDKTYTEISVNTENKWYQSCILNTGLIKPSTAYLAIVEVVENTLVTNFSLIGNVTHGKFLDSNIKIPSGQTGVFKIKLNSKSTFELDSEIKYDLFTQFGKNESVGNKIKLRLMLVEYVEGMGNWDIPYFEGMQSVRMPVLMMTGKNLLNNDWENGGLSLTNGIPQEASDTVRTKKFSQVTPITNYTVSMENFTFGQIYYYDKNYNFISRRQFGENNLKITTPDNCEYIKVQIVSSITDVKVQLEKGTVATSYEPHKTNILSTPEDVELRGIGDVRDTLDCLTGEVTERIGEIVLDGSEDEDWRIELFEFGGGNYLRFMIPLDNVEKDSLGLCDKLPSLKGDIVNTDYVRPSTNRIWVYKKDLTLTLQGFINELKNNSITVQYQLATESIKTVDLKGQKVYSYNETTHYTCSSAEGSLVPTLSIDVPTNLPALVGRQRNTIQELEKENEALKEEVSVVDQQRENGDLELLSSDFDLDFRLMEIEFALGVPMAAKFKEVRSMARTPYEMAKTLILGGKYERSDMEYKLGKYLERKQITQDQYDELIALMDANELI